MQGQVGEAYEILELMIKQGKAPNSFTYNTLLSGLCLLGQMDDAMKLFKLMID